MAEIISEQRFLNEYSRLYAKYESLSENTENNERWKKLGRLLEKMKPCYSANKIFTAKILGHFEKHQLLFKEQERAFVVQCIELLKKVLWEKKLNKK